MRNRFSTGILAVMMAGTMLLTGCGVNADATLVTINGGKDTISFGYGNFAAHYMQSMYDQMYIAYAGEEYWSQDNGDGTMETMVKDNIMDSIEEAYVVKSHAKDYNIELTDKEQKEITKAAKKFIKNNDKKTLKEMTATQEVVEEYLTNQTYVYKIQKAVEAEAKVEVDEEAAIQRTFSYAYFATVGEQDEEGNVADLSDEEIAEAKENAEALAEAEDFDKAAEEAEVELKTSTYGRDETPLDETVMKVVNALDEGQVSGVLEVEGKGYYVVRLDSANDKEATANEIKSLEDEQRSEHYTEVVEGWKKDLKWKVDKKQWAKVKFDNLFKTAEKDAE